MRAEPFPGRGPFAQPEMEPPLNAIYAQLRDLWRTQGPGRTYAQLAEQFGVATQNIAQWATGSDGRRPPWFVVMWLCEETGYELRGTARSWRIVPSERSL